MTQLPDDANATTSYMSNAARTEAEMKVALEQLHEVIAEIGSKAPETLTISGGSIATAPLSSVVRVRSEGYASGVDDELDTIETANITQGRVVVLQNYDQTSSEAASSEKITINYGASAKGIELTNGVGSTFVLCARRLLCVVYQGDHWVELWRSYGRKADEDKLAERVDLGLGDASVETIATASSSSGGKVLKVGSSNLATDDVLKIDSSGNIVAATSSELGGGDATTLDSLDSTAFVRSNAGTTQSIDSSLTLDSGSGDTTLTLETDSAATTPGVMLTKSGDERGSLFLDTSDGKVELRSRATGGGAYTPSIRLNPSTSALEFSSAAASSYKEVLHEGNISEKLITPTTTLWDTSRTPAYQSFAYKFNSDANGGKGEETAQQHTITGTDDTVTFTPSTIGVALEFESTLHGVHYDTYIHTGTFYSGAEAYAQIENSGGSVVKSWWNLGTTWAPGVGVGAGNNSSFSVKSHIFVNVTGSDVYLAGGYVYRFKIEGVTSGLHSTAGASYVYSVVSSLRVVPGLSQSFV